MAYKTDEKEKYGAGKTEAVIANKGINPTPRKKCVPLEIIIKRYPETDGK